MTALRRLARIAPLAVIVVLAVPGSAFGQASRTWVSGVGDDANPCSRTAPCKTFAGAISKTATNGEINVLDPGGFGGVTITKAITIKGNGVGTAGALVSGTNAIVINAPSTAKVTLEGLDINGVGTGAQISLVGIKVLSAGNVQLVNNEIYRFQAGIAVVPTSAQTRVLIARNHIHDNGIGVINAPGNNAITFTSTTVRNSEISDNTCGLVNGSGGTNASTPTATDCGTALPGAINKIAAMGIFRNGIHDNGFGVFTRGSLAASEIAFNEITGNFNFGLRRLDSGTIRTFTSAPGVATNTISNNAASDAPNATATLTKRVLKRVGRSKKVGTYPSFGRARSR